MIFESPIADIEIPESNLASLVLEKAEQLGDKIALVDGLTNKGLSFKELSVAVRQMSTGLQQRGFHKGDVFAIFCPNLPEYGIAFLGVAAAGGINTTVNSLYSTRELTHQLQDSGARFMLTVPEFLDCALPAARESGIEEIFVIGEAQGTTPFSDLLDNAGDSDIVAVEPRKDLVAMPYSSGTTGLSKGVMLSHYNLAANMCLSVLFNPVDENDSAMAVLPFFHIYGMVLILNMAIYKGMTLVTMPRFELEPFLEIIQQRKISVLNLVPPLIIALAKHPIIDQYDLSSIRLVSSGAAPLGQEMEAAVSKRLNCSVYQGYGLTEVAGASHINFAATAKQKPGSVGPVLPNTLSKVIDTETGAELEPNERGEILIKGPHVMIGYLNNAEATAHCIDADGWLHTGDIGYADEEGYFFVVDRVKELIKYKGFQVAPAELEAILLSHEKIADAAVIPSPDDEAGEIPKAFVVLKQEMSADEIMAFVAQQVSPHKKLRKVEFIDEIPKSAAGKILRRILVERERASLTASGQ